MGLAFSLGGQFRKGKLYPFVQLFKCKISIYQPYQTVQVKLEEQAFAEEDKKPLAMQADEPEPTQAQAISKMLGFSGVQPQTS